MALAAAQSDWKRRARNTLKTYYQSFSGIQWHRFNLKTDEDLLLVKICYGLHGPPTVSEATTLQDAYNKDQKKAAREMIDGIKKGGQPKHVSRSYNIDMHFLYNIYLWPRISGLALKHQPSL